MAFLERAFMQKLVHFQNLERFLALTLISIPAILWLVEYKRLDSISAYVGMCNSYVFGSLLTMAAMLYIFTGALYYKDPAHSYKGQAYNVILGILLLLVVYIPYDSALCTWHFVVAIGFFVGNALVIYIKSKSEHKSINALFGILVILPYVVYFVFNIPAYTLFWAEWISLFVIAIHFYLESKGEISFS